VQLAAAVALNLHRDRVDIATLKYQRATTRLLIRDKDASDAELEGYYALLNLYTGSKLSADSILKATVMTARDRYAKLGFNFDSPEFDAAIDETIRAMQG
jgi:hypothetical protein